MKYRYQAGEGESAVTYEVLLERHGDGYRTTVNGETYELEVLDAQPGALTLRFRRTGQPEGDAGDSQDAIRPQVVYWGAEGDVKWFSSGGCTYRLERPRERARQGRRGASGGGAAEDILTAPMPSQVRAVQAAEGDVVEAGQTLLLLEAMKMEIKLSSPREATVRRVLVKQGDTVERDQVLVELA